MEKASMYQILILTYTDVGPLEVLNTEQQHPDFSLYQLLLRKNFFGGLLLDLSNVWNEDGGNVLVCLISHSITNHISTAMSRKEEPRHSVILTPNYLTAVASNTAALWWDLVPVDVSFHPQKQIGDIIFLLVQQGIAGLHEQAGTSLFPRQTLGSYSISEESYETSELTSESGFPWLILHTLWFSLSLNLSYDPSPTRDCSPPNI